MFLNLVSVFAIIETFQKQLLVNSSVIPCTYPPPVSAVSACVYHGVCVWVGGRGGHSTVDT